MNPELLNESLVDLLQDMRGTQKEKVTRKRGKRIEPGKALTITPDVEKTLPEHSTIDMEDPQTNQQKKGKNWKI